LGEVREVRKGWESWGPILLALLIFPNPLLTLPNRS
jgi:hypothetical protein